VSERGEDFDAAGVGMRDDSLYVALKRLRIELWRSVPPFVTARWLFNEHPRWVIPVAVAVTATAVVLMISDWASRA
jgi:hypothetical protein